MPMQELRLLEEQQTVWLQFLLQLRGLAYLTEVHAWAGN